MENQDSQASEEKKPLTIEDITKEYQGTAMVAGDLQYRIAVMAKDLSLMNAKMQDLQKQAVEIAGKSEAVK